MLSKTELDQKFSALQTHGEAVAEKFKEFVQALDSAVPDGLAKTKLVNKLEEASGWAHTALADEETKLKNLAHQRAKSGAKPATTEPQSTPPTS
jgi:hypothetical protein